MSHEEKLNYMLTELLAEIYPEKKVSLPEDLQKRKALLRGLMNSRMPLSPLREDFLKIQDEYLKEEIEKKEIRRKDRPIVRRVKGGTENVAPLRPRAPSSRSAATARAR